MALIDRYFDRGLQVAWKIGSTSSRLRRTTRPLNWFGWLLDAASPCADPRACATARRRRRARTSRMPVGFDYLMFDLERTG